MFCTFVPEHSFIVKSCGWWWLVVAPKIILPSPRSGGNFLFPFPFPNPSHFTIRYIALDYS